MCRYLQHKPERTRHRYSPGSRRRAVEEDHKRKFLCHLLLPLSQKCILRYYCINSIYNQLLVDLLHRNNNNNEYYLLLLYIVPALVLLVVFCVPGW